jgi:hypothetical protein
MLEDIAPATRSHKKVKLIETIPGFADDNLLLESRISFRPFVDYLKNRLSVSTDTSSKFYNYLIEKFEGAPSLLQPVEDQQVLTNNQNLLELLGSTLFPVVSEHEKNMFTMTVPYHFTVFNYSPPFQKLFIDENEEYFLLPEEVSADYIKQAQCNLIYEHILEKFYGVKLNNNTELVYPVVDKSTGMKKYYKLRYDRRFIDIHLLGKLPLIQDCAVCMNTFRILDLEQQLKKMPLDLFAAEGFGVWIAEDITTQETLESIKKILLRQEGCDTESFHELKTNIHALVGLSDIEVGLTPFVKLNDEFVLDTGCTNHSLMGKKWKIGDEESISNYKMAIGFLTERPEPMAISILNEQLVEMAPFFQDMWNDGTRSYIIYPIQNNEGLLGILELSSRIPNQLNQDIMTRIEPAMPLLSLALLKNRDAFNGKIEKLIKEKFTALQPSVEWKFAEVVWEYMNQHNGGTSAETGKVVFDNVYPLYGAIDIRNSSTERNHAIQKDFKQHLNLVDETLDMLEAEIQLPLIEGMKFKNQNFQQKIDKNLPTEDEVKINEFFQKEVEPLFRHLQKTNTKAQGIVEEYFNLIQNCSSYLYKFRNEYESTMATINEAVLECLEREEEKMQRSYPHYFEKYRTDGIEYSIYIGQSISPNTPFDLLYLNNIRLWQLKSMAEIARVTHKLLPSLQVPLQTTQLILIHGLPISISFRKDERRFDVEGSYNIRYEILKKRLDKVCVKGTNERLTQPGKIAMVYSNPKEAEQYQEYIMFLQSKNLLLPQAESLELEELQGVSGLKALRVTINLDGY